MKKNDLKSKWINYLEKESLEKSKKNIINNKQILSNPTSSINLNTDYNDNQILFKTVPYRKSSFGSFSEFQIPFNNPLIYKQLPYRESFVTQRDIKYIPFEKENSKNQKIIDYYAMEEEIEYIPVSHLEKIGNYNNEVYIERVEYIPQKRKYIHWPVEDKNEEINLKKKSNYFSQNLKNTLNLKNTKLKSNNELNYYNDMKTFRNTNYESKNINNFKNNNIETGYLKKLRSTLQGLKNTKLIYNESKK